MSDIGIDALLDDSLGFGPKTFRTLKDVTAFPRRYFLAAQERDWKGYSPSIRVYVVLLAISSYLRYLYLGDGQVMTELYTEQFKLVIERLSEDQPRWTQVDPRFLADRTLEGLFFWNPFICFFGYTLFGMVWMAYAEKLPLAVRVRYIYALLIPASCFMLVATLGMVIVPQSMAGYVSFLSLFGGAFVVSITAYFGAFPLTKSRGGRLMRSIVLGVALIGVMLICATIAVIIGTFTAMSEAMAATIPVAAEGSPS